MAVFNPSLLVLAREARGLTQDELSFAARVAQGTLSKYETGIQSPSNDAAETLAGCLSFPASFFYQTDRPYGMPPYHYRKRKKLSAKALGRITAEMNIRRMHIQQMLVSFGETKTAIPEIDRDDYHGRAAKRLDIEDVARVIRESWMLPRGPVANMMGLLESHGAVIVPCDFGTDLIDALSQRIDGMPCLIFVNMHAPADRLRHTLAHELGHMALHTTTLHDDDKMEDEAEAFAGAFLMPADEIKPQLRKFDLRQLANMKGYWKVSMASIAVRADRLKLITEYQRKNFWIEMGKLGYRKREPNEPKPEHPRMLKAMVSYHMNKLGYSHAEMAKMLHLLPAEFEKMYSPEALGEREDRPKLRLVT